MSPGFALHFVFVSPETGLKRASWAKHLIAELYTTTTWLGCFQVANVSKITTVCWRMPLNTHGYKSNDQGWQARRASNREYASANHGPGAEQNLKEW